jgi:methionine salvage enolase-phosphatase E1
MIIVISSSFVVNVLFNYNNRHYLKFSQVHIGPYMVRDDCYTNLLSI